MSAANRTFLHKIEVNYGAKRGAKVAGLDGERFKKISTEIGEKGDVQAATLMRSSRLNRAHTAMSIAFPPGFCSLLHLFMP